MKCPCENCILYAICRTRLINMGEEYIRIARLADSCTLLHKFLYSPGDYAFEKIAEKRKLTWNLFKLKRRDSEVEI